MNTPEEIARKWAEKIYRENSFINNAIGVQPFVCMVAPTILQAAAEMVRKSGAVEALDQALQETQLRYNSDLYANTLNRLREITKHGETKP